MKINNLSVRINASYNTIKKFVEKNEDYYENINNVIHVTDEGYEALKNQYGIRSELMSDTDVDFYRAQIKFLSNQLEESKRYNQTFLNMIEIKNEETQIKEKEIEEKISVLKEQEQLIKELEQKIHIQELEKKEIKHELQLEKNLSVWKKIFRKNAHDHE